MDELHLDRAIINARLKTNDASAFREPPRVHKRNLYPARRVLTVHRPRPEPCRWFRPVRVAPIERVEGFVNALSHPGRPMKHIFRKSVATKLVGLAKSLRIIKKAQLNKMRDGIQVDGGSGTADAQCLERD
jgi:hypothetical protein